MGADFTSSAVVGLKIDPKKLTISKKVRSCKCDVKDIETMKFCPKCGEEVFTEELDCIPGYNEDGDLCGYKLIFGTDQIEAYVCAFLAEQDDYGDKVQDFTQLPDNIKEIKEKMRDTIGPLGLWDEKKFGLWSVLYCSY
jgi:hypothetical protein